MLVLVYALNESKWSNRTFINYIEMLPICFRERILRFSNWQDAQASLLGKLLLKHILLTYQSKYTLDDINIASTGRPYINDKFDFNITHSGSYVVCAYFDEGKVGVDIEIIKQIDIKDFKESFTEKEFRSIKSSTEVYKSFYALWTIKEASIKADGRGLIIPLKNVEVQDGNVLIQNTKWFYKEVLFKSDYILHIATDKLILPSVSLSEIRYMS
jgi:4'-phosphopantetheinyl transferase